MVTITVLDNYDSFTYNLVQYLWELKAEVTVYRNDEKTVQALVDEAPDRILISPGPCTPDEAGISVPLVQAAGKAGIPLLGVCLGHQSIGQAFGATVRRAERLMHGKTSEIRHDEKGLYTGIPTPYQATRYHSLIVDDLPDCLEPCAWSVDQGELMAIRHTDLPIAGVQYHPESFLTHHGHHLLRNFLEGRL